MWLLVVLGAFGDLFKPVLLLLSVVVTILEFGLLELSVLKVLHVFGEIFETLSLHLDVSQAVVGSTVSSSVCWWSSISLLGLSRI